MENQETKNDDVHIGSYVYRTLNHKISGLLRAERLRRGVSYVDIVRDLGKTGRRARNIECRKCAISWYTVAVLLKYYHKRIVLTLEDLDEDGRNLVLARMKDKPAGYDLDVIDD